jgi:hypothetical protein
MNEDRCVCCGAVVPEGTWVCINCKMKLEETCDGKTEKE